VPLPAAALRPDTGSRGEPPVAPVQELPPLSVSGFIQDEHANTLVIVNDRLLREGEEVMPGLKLEKITQDSVVFDYRGRRFKP
jgi:general secretion pathway protein B